MKYFKRYGWLLPTIALLCISIVLLAVMPEKKAEVPQDTDEAKTLQVYSTFPPVYLLSEMILQGIPDLEHYLLVQPQDGCLRDYAMSDWDLYQLACNADLIIENGNGLESFDTTISALNESGVASVALTSGLHLFNEDDTDVTDEDQSHLRGANPHLYMSISGAEEMLATLADAMKLMDPVYSDLYDENLVSACAALDDARSQIAAVADSLAGNKVFLMNEALVYTAQELGLEIAGQYDRESGVLLYDNEIESCLEAISGSGATVVFIEKQVPKALVQAVENEGFHVVRMDILSTVQSGTGPEYYIDAQLANAFAAKEAFNELDKE